MTWAEKQAASIHRALTTLRPGTLPGAGVWEVQPISLGPHHANFLAAREGTKVVVRLLVAPDASADYGADYEYLVLKYLNGTVSPQVYHLDETRKLVPYPLFLQEYLPGEHKQKLTRPDLEKLAGLFAELHSHRFEKCWLCPGTEDTYSLARKGSAMGKTQHLQERHPAIAARVQEAGAFLARHEKAFSKFKDFRLIHNDVHLGNILWVEKSPKLIDFHYARIGDPAEDIAFFFALLPTLNNYTLSDADRDHFMACYMAFSGDKDALRRLQVHQPLHLFYVALWYADQLERMDDFAAHTNTATYGTKCREIMERALKLISKDAFEG